MVTCDATIGRISRYALDVEGKFYGYNVVGLSVALLISLWLTYWLKSSISSLIELVLLGGANPP